MAAQLYIHGKGPADLLWKKVVDQWNMRVQSEGENFEGD